MIFIAKPFDELMTYELYEIMRARAKVFVGEEKILSDEFIEAGIAHVKMEKKLVSNS